MTKNSVLCNLIINNPTNWREIIAQKGISIGYDSEEYNGENYIILTYNMIDCDFSDPVVQESRGIILDITDESDPTVVAWPFRKFGNYGESYVDTIDWQSARIQEKVDGSIIKYWFDKRQNKWRFSTNGMIEPDANFATLLSEAKVTCGLNEDKLDKDKTYIFELISPRNQIVIKYDKTTLVHLGVRNNLTGEESKAGNIGVVAPKEYTLDISSLDDCITLVESLNKGKARVEHEGFVVVDKDWHRIKVKSPEYLLLHKQVSNHRFAKKDCIELIFFQEENVEDYVKNFPFIAPLIRFYQYQKELYCQQLDVLNDYVDSLEAEFNGERKAIALAIQNVPADKKWVMFEHLKTKENVRNILQKTSLTKLVGLFPDYPEMDVLDLIKK